MTTQIEEFAFCADHTTGYRRCDMRHGHTFTARIETSFKGDHRTIRGTVGRVAMSKLHMSHLNELEGLDQGEGGTVEAVVDWMWEQLEMTQVKPISIEVTELSASPTFELLPHTKRRMVTAAELDERAS